MGLIDTISNLLRLAQPRVKDTQTTETESRPAPALRGQSRIADSYYDFVDQYDHGRLAAYKDYDAMDNEVIEISRALDDHADLMTSSEKGDLVPVEIEAKDAKVKQILDDLNRRTHLAARLWSISREMVKYGDDFEELVVNSEKLIVRVKGLPVEEMERREDEFGRLQEEAFVQMRNGAAVAKFKEWQVMHFRNDRPRSAKYGRSLLKSARRLWRQLQLMEDGMVIGRLVRSHLRYKFTIPGGDLSLEEQRKVIEMYQNLFRKKRVIDPATGKISMEGSLMSADEDFFVCTSEENPADVGVLEGSATLGNIRDVEYFQNKLLTKLEIPKAMLAFERDVNAKSTLGTEDKHLVRKINRRRGQLAAGIRQIFDTQLVLLGVQLRPDLYELKFSVLATEDEFNKANIEKVKAETGNQWKNLGIPIETILVRVLGFTEEDAQKEAEKIEKAKADMADLTRAMMQNPEQPILQAEEWLASREMLEELAKFREIIHQCIDNGVPITH